MISKFPKTVLFFVVLLVLTGIVASMSVPMRRRAGMSINAAIGSAEERIAWARVERLAARNDPEGRYRVGRALLGRWYRDNRFAPPPDSARGAEMIRELAKEGYMPARLLEWELARGSAEDLYRMLPAAGATEWWVEVDWARAAFSECHAPLFYRAMYLNDRYFRRKSTALRLVFDRIDRMMDEGLARYQHEFDEACRRESRDTWGGPVS